MNANLKLVANNPAATSMVYASGNVLMINMPMRNHQFQSAAKSKPRATTYVQLSLVVVAHIAILYCLLSVSQPLPIIKQALVPLTVSLVSQEDHKEVVQPQVVPQSKPLPVVAVKKLAKTKNEMPIPVAESNVKQAFAESLVQPTSAVSEKIPETVTTPQVKHQAEVEPVAEPAIEPPRFGVAYLNNPSPDYPTASRRLSEQGLVLLRVFVSASGNAENVQVENSSGYSRLDQAATKAVKMWSFIPAKRNNQPLSAYVLVPIKFSLEG